MPAQLGEWHDAAVHHVAWQLLPAGSLHQLNVTDLTSMSGATYATSSAS